MSAPHLTHPKYRRDIDGLRAVSILSVVGFHAFPSWIKGGFIGVDVFFVISGFLISGIIFENLERGSFSFAEFYSRRIRRIFPALILILVACFILGRITMLPDDYKMLGKHIVAGVGFISNFALWQEAGYFDVDADMKPLLHLWSLGIEEQFYIVWPLLLWIVCKKRYNPLIVCAIITTLSFADTVFYMREYAIAPFYSPLSRFWELSLGALLAHEKLHPSTPLQYLNTWIRRPGVLIICHAQSWLGMALIATAVIRLNKNVIFPGYLALLPTLGAWFILSAGPQAWPNRVVLSNRILVWFGLISFPLYLWHWPLLSFARIVEGNDLSCEVRVAIVLVSIVLAWLTYRLIEMPLRFGGHSQRKVACLLAAMLCIGYLGFNDFEHSGYAFRYPPVIRDLLNVHFGTPQDYRDSKCLLTAEQDASQFSSECTDRSKAAMIFLWGDSHAASLYSGLKHFGDLHQTGVSQYTTSACPPILDYIPEDRPLCKNINEFILEKIASLKPDSVVLLANWRNHDLGKLSGTIARLQYIGIKKIIVIGPLPQWNNTLIANIVAHWKKDPSHAMPPVYIKDGLDSAIPILDQHMRTLLKDTGAVYISAYEKMCNADGCISRTGNTGDRITAIDYGHLSEAGSIYLSDKIEDYFVQSPDR